jgi:Ca2+-binding RTX toxin-like protein
VTMTAAQWAGFSAINLGVGTDVLNVVAGGDISALGAPTPSNVETGNLTGTTVNDTVTLSGAQLDAIVIGAGTINLGTGTDTINLTSTSADLNTLGAVNTSIAGVEAISAASAAAGVTITLTGQTEAFAITGSAQADIITGGTAADTIVAGSGDDTVTGGAGADVIDAGAGDDTINLATGQFVAAIRSRAAPTAAAAPATRSC